MVEEPGGMGKERRKETEELRRVGEGHRDTGANRGEWKTRERLRDRRGETDMKEGVERKKRRRHGWERERKRVHLYTGEGRKGDAGT